MPSERKRSGCPSGEHMRVVINTNVLISGLLFGGNPAKCLELALLGDVEMVLTEDTLDELGRKLHDERFLLKPSEALRFLALVRERSVLVEPEEGSWVPGDPDDDKIVAAALGGAATLIITGDGAILRASPFEGLKAVTPKRALRILRDPKRL
ncbi:MAG: putative toxin-antitoxin system toxin component, PIN family [Candidatus Thermoplasmatota archaeon]|nr:putative toxin-antitoxin system toxin component, PIN family [Candidatus Thermoplasmatota archaeon]